ncbi:MAG: dockerin type I domain-containing protein [Candidatus Levyibacteriota bacterium]
MAKTNKHHKKKFTKIFFEYGLHLWIVVFIMNVALFYAVNFYSLGKTCLTPQQVQSDNRCLYILNGKVYEKGTRGNPHQGHPCGTDVTSVLPPSHTNNPGMYLLPNYIGDVCSVQPTTPPPPKPTTKPTNTPQPAPTKVPAPTRQAPTIALPTSLPVPTHVYIPTSTSAPRPPVVGTTPLPTVKIPTPTVTAIVTRAISQPYTAVPTNAPPPTVAPLQGPGITFSFSMPAIGIGPGKTTPLHTTKAVTLNIYDAAVNLSNLKVAPTYTASASANYDANSTSATYTQFVVQGADLGTNVPAGAYHVAFKTNQTPLTLIKQNKTDTQGTLFHVTPGTVAVETPQVADILVGDLNGDDTITIQDYSIFVDCFGNKSASSSCLAPGAADLNDDGSVDGVDYNLLLKSISTASGAIAQVPTPTILSPTPQVTRQLISTPSATSSGLAKTLPSPSPTKQFVAHRSPPSSLSPTATPNKSLVADATLLTLSKVLSYIAFIILFGVAILGAYKSRLLNSFFHRGGDAKPPAPPPQPTAPATPPEQPQPVPVEQSPAVQAPPVEKKQISKVYYITGGTTAAINGRTMLTLTDDEGAHVGYTSQTPPQDGYYSVSGFEEEIEGVPSITILTLTPALKPGTNL